MTFETSIFLIRNRIFSKQSIAIQRACWKNKKREKEDFVYKAKG